MSFNTNYISVHNCLSADIGWGLFYRVGVLAVDSSAFDFVNESVWSLRALLFDYLGSVTLMDCCCGIL